MQEGGPPESQYKEDALRYIKGWEHGIVEAVQRTPDDAITRNRISDRQAPHLTLDGSTKRQGPSIQALENEPCLKAGHIRAKQALENEPCLNGKHANSW